MSNKTRSILKAIAVVIVLLCVAMQLQWVIIPSVSVYRFWLVVIAFGIMLISSK
jgi:antibiotic biosynthesis monooxygenase (ABM) superfamily enzyme